MEITRESAAGPHRLRVGEVLVVRLDENPTTGYLWQHAIFPPGALELVDSKVERKGELPGAGGTRRFTFSATHPGAARVILSRRRPWEPETAELERLELTVDVLE